jgi:hypothetical protein
MAMQLTWRQGRRAHLRVLEVLNVLEVLEGQSSPNLEHLEHLDYLGHLILNPSPENTPRAMRRDQDRLFPPP